MRPSLQHAALSVLEASLESTRGAAGGRGTPQASVEQLASLLQLLQLDHASSGIRELAHSAAQRYLEQTIGFENIAEVHLWLDSLRKTSAFQNSARSEMHRSAFSVFPAWRISLLLQGVARCVSIATQALIQCLPQGYCVCKLVSVCMMML